MWHSYVRVHDGVGRPDDTDEIGPVQVQVGFARLPLANWRAGRDMPEIGVHGRCAVLVVILSEPHVVVLRPFQVVPPVGRLRDSLAISEKIEGKTRAGREPPKGACIHSWKASRSPDEIHP